MSSVRNVILLSKFLRRQNPTITGLTYVQGSSCDRGLRTVGRYRSYSDCDMQNAIRAVVEEKCSITTASRTFSVPETTLKRKLPITRNRRQHRTLLTEEQESQLVKLMLEQLQSGRPLSKSEVCSAARKLLDSYSPRASLFKVSAPDWSWLVYFLKRNPEIPPDYFQSGNRQ